MLRGLYENLDEFPQWKITKITKLKYVKVKKPFLVAVVLCRRKNETRAEKFEPLRVSMIVRVLPSHLCLL